VVAADGQCIAVASGAAFVARGTVYHVTELDKLIERAMSKNGFSMVEIVSYCHTTFGRVNNMKSPIDMMRHLKDNSITAQAAEKLGDPAQLQGKIVRGVFHDEDKPEYTELYDQLIERAHGTPPMRKRQVRRGWM